MKPLIALALLASTLVALVVRLRRDAKAWAEWGDDSEIVGMPTWPYRGDVS